MSVGAVSGGAVVLAGELIDDITAKLGQVKTLLLIALGVFAVWYILREFMATRALGALVKAVLTIAIVLFAASNIGWLKTKLGEEVKTAAPAVIVIEDTVRESGPLDRSVSPEGARDPSKDGERS